jgi:hypothetical protein
VPAAAAVDTARKGLMQELSRSALGTTLASLQRLLRSVLLELVAALGAPGASASTLLAAVDTCLKSLADAVLENGSATAFWEKTV